MTTDCSLFMRIVSSEYLQNMLCTQIVVFFWHSEQFWDTTCSADVASLWKRFTSTSYCPLAQAWKDSRFYRKMGTPNNVPYLVPEKWQNNEFHRIISPGKSENWKRRIEKEASEDNDKKNIKVEENCISIHLLEPEYSIKQEAEDHCDKNIQLLGENWTPNNIEEGKNEKNVENLEKEDCKLEVFDKEGLILSKSDDKIGQLFQCALCEKKFSYNVIWYNSKPTLMKHILKSHEKEVSNELLETKAILEKHDSDSKKQKNTPESFQDEINQTNKNCSNTQILPENDIKGG